MIKKSFILLGLIVVLLLPIFVTGCGRVSDRESLNVYNWGDYIDMSVIREFEEEFNVKVNYNTFATNEDMYVAIKKGGTSYDVAFPSDYMIERMRKEDLLEKLDQSLMTNRKYIGQEFLGLDYDPKDEYSLPFFWGTVGIAYNTKYVSKEEVESWDILWDEKYEKEILMLDSQRDSFAVALKKLGYSMNTRSPEELNEAKDELIKQKPLVYAYIGDEVKDLMVAEEAQLAVVWSGDAIVMVDENEDLDYSVPKEGTNLWFDSMVIPKNAKNKKMANEFINFMQRPEIAARNADYVGYSTPNMEALKYMDEDLVENPIAYPDLDSLGELEVFQDPKDMIRLFDDLWIEVKAHR